MIGPGAERDRIREITGQPPFTPGEVVDTVMELVRPNLSQERVRRYVAADLDPSKPEEFIRLAEGQGGLLFKGVPAARLDSLARRTLFSPLGETDAGGNFISYLRGRADTIREMATTPPVTIVNMAKPTPPSGM